MSRGGNTNLTASRERRAETYSGYLMLVLLLLALVLQVYGIARTHHPLGWLLWLGG